jgi:hypothetical protein
MIRNTRRIVRVERRRGLPAAGNDRKQTAGPRCQAGLSHMRCASTGCYWHAEGKY